jgi:hypothetical protein
MERLEVEHWCWMLDVVVFSWMLDVIEEKQLDFYR